MEDRKSPSAMEDRMVDGPTPWKQDLAAIKKALQLAREEAEKAEEDGGNPGNDPRIPDPYPGSYSTGPISSGPQPPTDKQPQPPQPAQPAQQPETD